MKWTSVSKKRPERGDTVLALWGDDRPVTPDSYGVATYAHPGHWHNPENDEDDYRAPSHWMPLPVPPSE